MKESTTSASYVIFRLGDEEYGLPVERVSGIIRYEPATPVPRAPVAVLGVINLRGRVIPVIDLRLRFSGVPFVEGPQTRIVVSEGDAGPVGIVVDSASEVASFDVAGIRPVPDGVLAHDTMRAFTGVVERVEGHLVILLDLEQAVPRSQYAQAVDAPGDKGDSDV